MQESIAADVNPPAGVLMWNLHRLQPFPPLCKWKRKGAGFLHRSKSIIFLLAVFGAVLAGPASAQNMDKAANEIVGDSDVRQEPATNASEREVLAAIDKTVESTSAVRKLSAAKRVDIVVLAGQSQAERGSPDKIGRKLKDHQSEIAALRQEVEANALLFHAVDSKRIMTKDILAVGFPDAETVVVYAAGKPAG